MSNSSEERPGKQRYRSTVFKDGKLIARSVCSWINFAINAAKPLLQNGFNVNIEKEGCNYGVLVLLPRDYHKTNKEILEKFDKIIFK
jgi:hypothetical protein